MYPDDLSEGRLKEVWCGRIKIKPTSEATPESEGSSDNALANSNDQSNGAEDDSTEERTPTPNQSDEQDKSHDLVDELDGFNEEPFVKAVVAFRQEKFIGILELLTEAVTAGEYVDHVS